MHGFQQQHLATRIFNGFGSGFAGKHTPIVLRIRNHHLVRTELLLNGVSVIQSQDVVGIVLTELVRTLFAEVGM